MIPEFPQFKKLELSDKKEIEKFTIKFPPHSSFNFTNIWAWNIRGDRKISKLNDNLVIFFTDYDTENPFLSFLGINKCEDTVLQLINFANKSGLSPKLRFITEESIKYLNSDNFIIEEDRDNFDYIFYCSELSELKGVKFKNQRHLAARFIREYPDSTFKLKDFSNLSVQEKINFVLTQWENGKKMQNKRYDLRFEEKALYRLFESVGSHNLILSCVFLNDIMLGFSIDEILPNQNAIAHFIKADNSFRGIYEFLNNELAKYLITLGVVSWNWQQDLNIENLRKTKISYRPVSFLKKYTVSLPDQNL